MKYSWIAAVVNRENVVFLVNVKNEDEHVMCFRVIAGDLEFIVINVYSVPLERFLTKIESLINYFPTEKVLLILDINANQPCGTPTQLMRKEISS